MKGKEEFATDVVCIKLFINIGHSSTEPLTDGHADYI